MEESISTDILSSEGSFSGKADVSLLNSELLKEHFAFDKQDKYKLIVK